MIRIEKINREDQWLSLIARPKARFSQISEKVSDIIDSISQNGDRALRAISLEIDGSFPSPLALDRRQLKSAGTRVDSALKEAIRVAIENIQRFHEAQLPALVKTETMPGIECWLRFEPIERIGVYVPGGSAPLLSTALMTLVPARVAGCCDICVCTPPGAPAELLYVLGLFEPIKVYQLGGAQAIAAMALGTESIQRVDKVVGPGNAWVTEAKMQLAAKGLAIDMPAGPSELLIIADSSARADFLAADMLSQAEHDPDSQVVLICTSEKMAREVNAQLKRQLADLPRREIARQALGHSLILIVDKLQQALRISNAYAPEHLILAVKNPDRLSAGIRHAGSVFMGHLSAESAGDYASGTNHTLPTGGFSRAWSGLNTLSFMKSISFQQLKPESLERLVPAVAAMARAEQLEAHARAMEIRLKAISK